jgi:DNA invertase Pin-like site-specific DNA recombinase
VIGYAAGRDRAECGRHARTIERACAERGWQVSAIVCEGRAGQLDPNGRRGLALALEQLSQGVGGRLVTSRLNDVGSTRRDLATLLAWCSRTHVELVALDVGLDTGTAHGRLAACCLAAVGDSESNRSGRGRPSGTATGGATERTAQEVQS